MRALDRKLLRELRGSAGASLAILAVVAAGVAVLVMALSTLAFLVDTRDAYYDRYRLGHVFALLSRAPLHVADDVAALPGVAAVQTRIVQDITIRIPGLAEPASARLVSLEPAPVGELAVRQRRAGLNAIHLLRGRYPDPDSVDEVVASEAFVEANALPLGSSVQGILNGRSRSLRIVGVGLSPEYVFQIRSGDFLPDDRRFGVFWTSRGDLEGAFDMGGAFNDLSLRLMREVPAAAVIAPVDDILRPHGGVGAVIRDDLLSVRFLDDEIKQLQATGLIVPIIFFTVAACLLNIVLARRIELQRQTIATLKAFGYSDRAIVWHFLQYALLVAAGGAAAGGLLGSWLAAGLCELYSSFFRFPVFIFRPSAGVIAVGAAVSMLSAALAASLAASRAARLRPADAMRPPAPATYRHGWIDALCRALRLPPLLVMIPRRLGRRPWLTMISLLGISMATAVMLVSNFMMDAVEEMIDFQFVVAQRQDIRVTMQQASDPSSLAELRNLPGVVTAEPFRSIPCRLRAGHRHRQVGILGLESPQGLYRLLDAGGRPIRLPPRGLVLSDKLAELLDVGVGDEVRVEVLEDRRQRVTRRVVGLVTEYAGLNAYMDRDALHGVLQEDRRLSGALLHVDPGQLHRVYQALEQTPRVAAIEIKSASLQAIRGTIRENQAIMQTFNVVFATVIALGVVYNMARVTMQEQQRELATLRVIGFTRAEVSTVFLGELLAVTAAAIPLGWAIGSGLCYAVVLGFESELYRIPLVISRHNLAVAALVTAAAALASGLIVRRGLDRLDLVEVLKEP